MLTGTKWACVGDELFRGRFCRKPEYTMMFTERERGMTVYYAACYENAKGEAGLWSFVIEATIG